MWNNNCFCFPFPFFSFPLVWIFNKENLSSIWFSFGVSLSLPHFLGSGNVTLLTGGYVFLLGVGNEGKSNSANLFLEELLVVAVLIVDFCINVAGPSDFFDCKYAGEVSVRWNYIWGLNWISGQWFDSRGFTRYL